MVKFATNFNNLDLKPRKPEVNNEPSMTIPGESYTVTELLGRSMRGMDIRLMERHGIYEDDPDYDSDMLILRKPDLDLTDIDSIGRRLERTKQLIKERAQKPNPEPEPDPEPEPEPNPDVTP